MKQTLKSCLFLSAAAAVLAGAGCGRFPSGGRVSDGCPLTPREVKHFLKLARSLGNRLWTNDYCVAGWPECEPPTWEWESPEKIVREFSDARWCADELMDQDAYWRKQAIIIFSSQKTNIGEFCHAAFLMDKPRTVTWIQNRLYMHPNIPFRRDGRPLHATAQQARQRAAAYASLLGVSGVWDETRFIPVESPPYSEGEWQLAFQAVRNGFPAPYYVSVRMADLPGLPLGEWRNETDKIPERLPAELSVASGQAAAKAREYLKTYCVRREIAPGAVFVTNSVQYIAGERDSTGKSGCRLAWRNTFQIPQHEKAGLNNSMPVEICVCGMPKNRHIADHLTIVISVDAETGEFLGGEHWD
jgi:hypothetical protein